MISLLIFDFQLLSQTGDLETHVYFAQNSELQELQATVADPIISKKPGNRAIFDPSSHQLKSRPLHDH